MNFYLIDSRKRFVMNNNQSLQEARVVPLSLCPFADLNQNKPKKPNTGDKEKQTNHFFVVNGIFPRRKHPCPLSE